MSECYDLNKLLIQKIIIKNAQNIGWNVNQITDKKYILRRNKYTIPENENTEKMLDRIFDVGGCHENLFV